MLTLFRRPQTQEPTVTEQPTQMPYATVMQFLTLGGASVDVYTVPNETGDRDNYCWECRGCDASDSYLASGASLHCARTAANGHASNCRSMPRPTTA